MNTKISNTINNHCVLCPLRKFLALVVLVLSMPSLPAFRFLRSMHVMRTASRSMPTMMRAGTTKAMMYSCGGSRS